jgi:hypothetical protein
MEKKYYIHINSNSLPHYLVDGIIRPANLIKNRENDFQNNCGNQLILSLKKWNSTSDCSIEIVLNNTEKKSLDKISSDFSLFYNALPISRIKKIHFSNKEKAEGIIWNINNTVAFVPIWAIEYSNKDKIELAEDYSFNKVNQIKESKDLVIKLKRFDRLLGGLAFLKVIAEMNSNNKINFSQSYFSTLAYFNKGIVADIKKNNVIINDKFHEIFKGDSRIFNYLGKPVDAQVVQEVSKKEGVEINSKFGVVDIKSIPENSLTFKLVILESYGKGNSKSVEDLISGLLTELNEKTSEEIALIYGLHVGYNVLRNYYKISNKKIQVKYDLSSKIDFYTIESLYQYAFNNKEISNDFDYLSIKYLSGVNQVNKDPRFKYLKMLNDFYPYKKIDYKVEKETIIEALIKEISKWFPVKLFKINEAYLSEKINKLIAPTLNSLIEKVQLNTKEIYLKEDIEPKRKEVDSKVDKKEQLIIQKKNNGVSITPDQGIAKSKYHYKEPVDNSPDLFNNTNETEIKIKIESNSKAVRLNALELDKIFTIPKLRKYAEELNISIPKSITKKADIIKLILSNQN